MQNCHKTRQAGFTLIELIVMLMVMGLLAISIIPLFPSEVDRVGMARQVAQDLRLAQSYAMALYENCSLVVTNDTTYEIRNASGTVLSSHSVQGVVLTPVNLTITFDPMGGIPVIPVTTTLSVVRNGSTDITLTGGTGRIAPL